MTLGVADQRVSPDSKPGFLSRLLSEGGGGVAAQVAAPGGTAMAENDASMPVHTDGTAGYRSLADWMAPSRAAAWVLPEVRYVVRVRYQILAAASRPIGVTAGAPPQVGLLYETPLRRSEEHTSELQ